MLTRLDMKRREREGHQRQWSKSIPTWLIRRAENGRQGEDRRQGWSRKKRSGDWALFIALSPIDVKAENASLRAFWIDVRPVLVPEPTSRSRSALADCQCTRD